MTECYIMGLILFMGFFDFLDQKTFEESFKKEMPFRSGQNLNVINQNGHICVSSWDKETLLVEAVKTVRHHSEKEAKRLLSKIDIKVISKEDYIKIITTLPRANAGVEFNIHLPQSTNLGLKTSNGRIEVKKFDGEINLSTINGAIECQETSGKIIAKTSNGRIILTKINGEVLARTNNGRIEAKIESLDENYISTFETSNGRITLYIPEDLNPFIYAHTSNGQVRSTIPIFLNEADLAKKEGIKIKAKTSNGSIVIDKTKKVK